MQSLLFSPHIKDHPAAMTNPVLCSVTLWGQLHLLRHTESASGSQDRTAGMLIDGRDAYQPHCVTDA